jgi:signal transduction histidine kinase
VLLAPVVLCATTLALWLGGGWQAAIVLVLGVAIVAAVLGLRWLTNERMQRQQAMIDERRLLAADLHDLVLQDLALALAHARSLQERVPEARAVVEAGERALTAARQLTSGLAAADSTDIAEAVRATVSPLAERASVPIRLNLASGEIRPGSREALVGIAREAVINALKHGEPQSIDVEVSYDGAWKLRIRDDGVGFDPDTFVAGYGLFGMRQRAQAAGGDLRLLTNPGDGTVLEAMVP